MNTNQNPHKLEYPRQWVYKVIGPNPDNVRSAIEEVMGKRPCLIESSNTSRTGKYHSMRLEVRVSTEKDRNDIYQALTSSTAVKMVI